MGHVFKKGGTTKTFDQIGLACSNIFNDETHMRIPSKVSPFQLSFYNMS